MSSPKRSVLQSNTVLSHDFSLVLEYYVVLFFSVFMVILTYCAVAQMGGLISGLHDDLSYFWNHWVCIWSRVCYGRCHRVDPTHLNAADLENQLQVLAGKKALKQLPRYTPTRFLSNFRLSFTVAILVVWLGLQLLSFSKVKSWFLVNRAITC